MTQSAQVFSLTKGVKSFLGFLEGTHKSGPTIASYHRDLKTFQNFWRELGGVPESLPISRITLQDLLQYQDYLRKNGFKTNTRRRKLLTVRRLFRYLNKRKKTRLDVSSTLPAPYKVERSPKTIDYATLQLFAKGLPERDEVEVRDKLLVFLLLETACAVRELIQLRRADLTGDRNRARIQVGSGGSQRTLEVSRESLDLSQKLLPRNTLYFFLGFNRFGPLTLGAPLSARTIEFLFKHLSNQYKLILDGIAVSPRSMRHSVVLHWLRTGITEAEIQKRLGLKSDYAFRVYRPLLKPATKSQT